MSTTRWRNWAGNQASSAPVARPASTDEVVELVQQGRRIKPVGAGHSFTDIAYADDLRLELAGLAGVVSVDRPARLVTVQAGMRLRALNQLLAEHGLALANLGDIADQTIAGAISTGTHGTGAAYGCLSTFVEALTLVTGTGKVLHCSASSNPEVFAAARVGLGALGVITEVTLRCVDAFVLHASERSMPLASVLSAIDSLVPENDHFEFYWFPYTDRANVKRNNRVPANDRPLSSFRSWWEDEFVANTLHSGVCQLGRAAPALVPAINAISARTWGQREYTAPSAHVFCSRRHVRFVEMEYGVPRSCLPEAFAGLRRVVEALPFKVQFPVEVRFTAADDIWLSHGYERESAYIAIHQYVGTPYEPYFRAFERVVTPLGGRPHWGKLHYRDASSLRTQYPRFGDFLAVRDRLDPDRVFANPYLERVLGA